MEVDVKIKRYIAASMRLALGQVRAEQGPDAVILSSRRVEEGIEVIAAVDYDEALFAGATRQRSPITSTPEPAATGAAPVVTPTVVPVVAPSVAPVAAAPARAVAPSSRAPDAANPGYYALQNELKDLRLLLQSELASLSWHDKRLREPLQTRVLEELSSMDIAPDVANELAAFTPRKTSLKNPSHIPLALLVKHLPIVDALSTCNGGVIAIVGPTGAGKTTTIAKLAARWSMQHGSQDLALVSTDAYRIGAREQLATYARLLGAPMHTANDGRELSQVLERLKAKRLVLIDTAGMAPRDVRLTQQLAALQLGAARAKVLLALPAQCEGHALEEIMGAFARVSPSACILTKVDEAASLGAVLSTTLRHKLPIAYLCNGQRVPEDLHSAHQHRVWLARTAQTLRSRAAARPGPPPNFARQFSRVHAHA
jgi:flagellar biosynthesis protein FlhF